MLQTGWQTARLPRPIQKSGWTVAQLSAPKPPMRPALCQRIPNSITPVLHLQQHQYDGPQKHFAGRVVHRLLFPHKSHAGGLAAGVQLHANGLHDGVLY